MSPEFNELVVRAHALGLKIGPIAERPDGQWRVYVQKGSEIMQCREGATIEEGLRLVLDDVDEEPVRKAKYVAAVKEKMSAPAPGFLE